MSVPEAAIEAAIQSVFPKSATVDDFKRRVWEPLVRQILEAAAPHIRAQTAEVIANGLQSWGGVSERAYVEGFAEAAWGKCGE